MMGAGFAILGLFAIFILVFAIALFFILKKRGYLKIGIVLSSVLALIVLIPIFSFVFESELYFKSDAEDDLKLLNIYLKDDFEIISNRIVGVNNYYQITYLKISNYDKSAIIDGISRSEEFNETKLIQAKDSIKNSRAIKTQVWNYMV